VHPAELRGRGGGICARTLWARARRRLRRLAAVLASVLLATGIGIAPAQAQEPTPLATLVTAAAQRAGVNPYLLGSIVWVESRAWPWALNVKGAGVYPRTRAEAERVLSQVGDDVDIGYAQVSYRHWGRALGLSKNDLLDPSVNLVVGAFILRHGMDREAGWGGVGRYHSATPYRKLTYALRVAEVYRAIAAQGAAGVGRADATSARAPR
jgi:hypothetical protein